MAVVEIEGKRLELKDLVLDDPHDRAFVEIVKQAGEHTMTVLVGLAAPYALFRAIEHVVRRKIPGDIVECGVWKGGSMMIAALALKHFGETSRTLRLFDTFEGMTEPTEHDIRIDGRDMRELWKDARMKGGVMGYGGSLRDVRARMTSTGYPEDNVVLVKGDVLSTLPASAPQSIALLRLDTDWYESTKHELEQLYPRLSPGGILIIDDYGYCLGARKATDDYFATLDRAPFLARIDETVRLAIKPGE